jgi:hypothetical protein
MLLTLRLRKDYKGIYMLKPIEKTAKLVGISKTPGGAASPGGAAKTPGQSGTQPGGATQSRIHQIQQQYPEAAQIIATMQRYMIDLSKRIQMLQAQSQDKNAPKRKEMGRLIGETQNKQAIDAADDGVWGKHTEDALKALNNYVAMYFPDKAASIGRTKENRIPTNLMSQTAQIQSAVDHNLGVIAKVLAEEGDPSYLLQKMPANQELDKIPQNFWIAIQFVR